MEWRRFSLSIEFTAPYLTPLQADTIFGEFCWRYRFLYGEEELLRLLGEESSLPAVAFSDAIPEGMVPFPKLPLSLPFGSIKEYSGLKKVKKRRYLRISTLGELLSCLTFNDRVSAERDVVDILLRESGGGKALKEETTIHVSINRLTDTAHPGKLFHLRETFTEDGFRFRIYGLYRPGATSLKEVVETFTFMGLDGFGAKKSAGKGKFAVVEEEEGWGPLESIERGGKWFISLSTGLPDRDEIEDGYGEFFTKFPKHGREVARAEVFKNPLILSRPGSLFKAKEKKPLYGSTVAISAPSLRGHRHSRLVVPLFVG